MIKIDPKMNEDNSVKKDLKTKGIENIIYRLKMIFYTAKIMSIGFKKIECQIYVESDSERLLLNSFINAAAVDSFLIHIRALNEFLIKTKVDNKSEEVVAKTYLQNEYDNFKKTISKLRLQAPELDLINKLLSHINIIDNDHPTWEFKEIHDRFFKIFQIFFEYDETRKRLLQTEEFNDPNLHHIFDSLGIKQEGLKYNFKLS